MPRFFSTLLYLSLALLLSGCGPAPQKTVAPPVPVVNVSVPIPRDAIDYEVFTGRTDAVSTVDVRARVSGYLTKVNFKDGDLVKQNDLLYEIDPRPFQATLDQAKGEVETLEAQKKLLAIQVARYTDLASKGAGSQQDLDQYMAQQAENVGQLKTAAAKVASAQLNLEFTRVTSPITGKISRTYLTIGNLVNADTSLLTTVMSIDPMYAYFNIEEPVMLRIQKLLRDGVITSKDRRDVEMRVGLADDVERAFPLRASLDFVNNTVDAQTGTIQVRCALANPHQPPAPPLLTPGLFVRIRLPVGPKHRVLLVNERAIGTDQGRKFVYALDEHNKIVYRGVKLGLLFDGLQAVEDGLKDNERIVVNGLQRVRPGIEVRPEPVDMATLAPPAGTPTAGKPAAPGPKS